MASLIWKCIGGMVFIFHYGEEHELLEKSLDWYFKVAGEAKHIAKRQGFDGLRWQKMTDNEGDESSIFSWCIS